jgi:ABC-type amino acid transport substrate-binding protein
MKNYLLVMMLIASLLLAACGAPSTPTELPATPTAVPPTATETTIEMVPTQAPPTSDDPTWDRVQSTGKIVFGTSADYAPFEYYDDNYQIIGFDAALARELGARLGFQIEFKDIAFEGLPTALQIGQIDAAIAAISVTPNRQAIMDFTNVYYYGQDMVLARLGSGYEKIIAPAQLGIYRVGVERGSVYQTWIQTSLVNEGLMPSANLFAYEKPEHAIRDLKENRIDVVVMDRLPAEEYLLEGGLESVGEGLNTQLLAIALPKGAGVLQGLMNDSLTQLQNNGTIAELSNEYLNIDTSNVLPIVTPTPIAFPTKVASTPTAMPNTCYDGLEFVADVTIPDHTVIGPGQGFDKTWRLRNTGTCTWDDTYRIVFVQGDRMDGDTELVRGTVRPGETYDMTIDQRAPNTPGKYGGVWQMTNGQKAAFGTRVWVKIKVRGNEPPPTAIPQPTAVPPVAVQPTLAPPPAITVDYFTASANSVSQGDLVTVSWSFSGQGLSAARLTRTNPDGTQTALYGAADVDFQGAYDDLLMDVGTYTYSLSVSTEFAGNVVKTVSVQVDKKSK